MKTLVITFTALTPFISAHSNPHRISDSDVTEVITIPSRKPISMTVLWNTTL